MNAIFHASLQKLPAHDRAKIVCEILGGIPVRPNVAILGNVNLPDGNIRLAVWDRSQSVPQVRSVIVERSEIATATDLCAIASEQPIANWPAEITEPIAISRSIFGELKTVFAETLASESLPLVDCLVWCGLATFKSQARTAINAGAVRINGEQCRDVLRVLVLSDFARQSRCVLENGKRNYYPIHLEGIK